VESYRVCDYLKSYEKCEDKGNDRDDGRCPLLNSTSRMSICEWMYRVVDYFGIDREVVSIAISYVDRVLSVRPCPDLRTFKLISSASLHLATKIHFPWQWIKIYPLLPGFARGDFRGHHIVAMEDEITHCLKWYLNQSTPQSIGIYLLSLLKGVPDSVLQDATHTFHLLIEESVCNYEFVAVRNSVIAIAAVLNAGENIVIVGLDSSFMYQIKTIISSIGYNINWEKVESVRDRLWSLCPRRTVSSKQQNTLSTHLTPPKRSITVSSPTSVIHAKRFRSQSDFVFRAACCNVD